jgi:8-oxo-dGTP pyrophosphatase MutT (NUDIX family)
MDQPVPVVRLIVPDDEGRVLLLRRHGSTHGLGAWCLPGGKVDYGQRVEEAVADELREETALECTGARFLFYQDSLPYEPGGMHCVNLYFECQVSGTIRLNEESSEYAWVGPEELEQYEIVFRNDAGLMRYWRQNV